MATDERRTELLNKTFWTMNDLCEFIGIKRQRLYKEMSKNPGRFPEFYKRRGLWESPPAPRILRHPNPSRQRRGPLLDYIEWWEQRNPVREAERLAG